MRKKPRILLLTTGGTIATTETDSGPVTEYKAEELLQRVPEVLDFCTIDGKALTSIDSVNMEYEHWVKIAREIYNKYEDYDGFVITHGTDTMGYTAAALTYMLQGIGKTVVLTGGQKSIEIKGGDSRRNFIDAVRFACENVSGIYVVFYGKVIAGTRAVKVKTKSYEGFRSINYPYVAEVMGNWVKYTGEVEVPYRPQSEIELETEFCTEVLLVKLIPGLRSDFFRPLQDRYRGFVIEGFGNGGIPFDGNNLLVEIKKLTAAGKVVVITTQCLEEGTNLGRYPVRKEIENSDIIDGRDMNSEAVISKLMWALGKTEDVQEIQKLMYTPIENDIEQDWIFQ